MTGTQIRLLLVLLVLLAVCFLDVRSAQAQRISPQNPFLSYNISGVNYGSQQWEWSQASKPPSSPRSGRIFIRRR
ncbi:MAG: hypothetical protein AABP62_14710 [Planctomycetota bacterium]